MPWKVKGKMEQRIEFVLRAKQRKDSFSELCREFGISRPTGYLWLNRYKKHNSFAKLTDKSRRPHRSPFRISDEVEKQVIELRNQYGWAGKKLKRLLAKKGISIGEATIDRVIRRNGLVESPHVSQAAPKRFERAHCNELWQMDFKGQFDHGTSHECYPLSILDDRSRYLLNLNALGSTGGLGVDQSLVRVFRQYGVPQGILMDHGSPWWSTTNGHGLTWLSVGLIKQGIRLHYSGKGHPQTQGKVERFHRTLKRSILRREQSPKSLKGYDRIFKEFREEYNHIRPHEALDFKTPGEIYKRSQRLYQEKPKNWEYPEGTIIKRLNTQGCLDYKGYRYFVCEALASERIKIDEVESNLLISYRHMTIREIDLVRKKSNPVIS